MLRRLLVKFFQISIMVLNLQLIFAPLAIAQQAQQKKGWDGVSNIANIATQLLNNATQAYTQGMQQGGGDQVAMIEARLSPMMKLQPIDPREVPKPLQGCLVLPATGTTPFGGMSCQESSDPQVQSGYADAMTNIAKFNLKQLENYTTEGHARYTSQGVGCYDKKIESFEGSLKAREEELSLLQAKLKERMETFKLTTKADLEGMRQGTALLTGKPEKYLKDINLEDMFFGKNDKGGVCASVMQQDVIKEAAISGFRGIKDTVFAALTDKSNGSLTPEEVLTNSDDIESDIKSFASKLADKTDRRGELEINLKDTSLSSRFIDKTNSSLNTAIENYNTDIKEELVTLEKELKINQAVSNPEAEDIVNKIREGDINLNQRLAVYEKNYKNACIQATITNNFGSVDAFTQKFQNPNVSRKLNKSADNAFATKMSGWIKDPTTGLDVAVEEITNLEKKGINSSRVIITGKSFSIRGKTISASTPLRASQLFRILADNCKDQYTNVTNDDGFTAEQMVAKLKQYGSKVHNMRRTAKSKIKSMLKEEMLTCPTDTTAGVAALSCSNAMDLKAPRFCLRTARKCASNLKGCFDKSKTFVDKTEKDREKLATRYNREVDHLKKNLKKDLLNLNKFMEVQARSLDAQLDMGTVFKINPLVFNLNADFLYQGKDAEGLSEELKIEDPDRIFEMANKQMETLKKSLVDQRVEQMAKINKEKSKYVKNYESQKRHWNQIIGECQGRNKAYDDMVTGAQQQAADDNLDIQKACNAMVAMNAAPCFNIEEAIKTYNVAILVAPKPQGQDLQMANYQEQQTLRSLALIQAECEPLEPRFIPRKELPSDFSPNEFCEDFKNNPDVAKLCDAAEQDMKRYRNTCTADNLTKGIADLGEKVCNDDGTVRFGPDCISATTSDMTLPQVEQISKSYETLLNNNKRTTPEETKFNKIIEKINAEYAQRSLGDESTATDKKINQIKEDIKTSRTLANTNEEVAVTEENLLEVIFAIATVDKRNTQTNNLDIIQDKENCFILEGNGEYAPNKIKKIIDVALGFINSHQSQAQMGEQHVSPAMCNGGYTGEFDSGPGAADPTGMPPGYNGSVVRPD